MRKIIAIALVCFICVPLFSDEAAWYEGKPISNIVFAGLDHVNLKDIESVVRPYIGKAYKYDLESEIVAKLMAMSVFDDIPLVEYIKPSEQDTSSVVLRLTVIEKPIVDSIVIDGEIGIKEWDIIAVVTYKVGDTYISAKLYSDEAAIKALYLSKGYGNVTVKSEVVPIAGKNAVQVKFTIVEGNLLEIKSIRFSGNTSLSEATLKGLLVMKEPSFFSKSVYEELKLSEDKKAIITYYKDHGYVDADITDVQKQIDKDPNSPTSFVTITYYIKEGKQYVFGGMKFDGNKVFTQEKLSSLLSSTVGKVVNWTKLQQDIGKVAQLYYENGYIFYQAKSEEVRDEEKNTLSIVLHITEEDRAYIESLTFKGNVKTKEEVMRREFPLQEGDIFSISKFQEGLYNLLNLQYFSSVKPEFEYGSDNNLMNLIINVEEQSTLTFNSSLSFAPVLAAGQFPLSITLGISDINFLGNGTSLSANITLATTQQLLSFSYTDSWLFGQRISGGIEFSVDHETVTTAPQDILGPIFPDGAKDAVPDPYSSYAEYKKAIASNISIPFEYLMSYELWKFSVGASAGYRFHYGDGWVGVGGGLSLGIQYVIYDSTKYRPFDEAIRGNLDKWIMTNKFSTYISYDSRKDLTTNPYKGIYVVDRLSVVGLLPPSIDLEKQYYIRNDLKADAYFLLFSFPVDDNNNFKGIFAMHAGVSFIFPGFDSSGVRISSSDKLGIDGSMVARGWSGITDRQLALFDSWMEFRFPIWEQFAWFDLFFDAATLSETPQSFFTSLKLSDFKFDFGIDIRFTIRDFPFKIFLSKRFYFDDAGNVVWPKGSIADFFDIGIGLSLSIY